MKKFLSLVLALVMTASLVTVSAAETKVDFTDDSSITYTEAVDVMTAIGVVGGYTDGSFAPNGTLTRGAAAKIICNMILGPTTAGALSADTAPFKDVPVSHTFAGYIAYCAQEGIISGYADGTFQPANTLTGYAFMKMLLGALGYDSKVEGYVGANWSVAVAKRALSIDLDEDLEGAFVGSKALTREEACLYAFNTLMATMVEYDSTIVVGDVTIAGSKAKAIYENTAAAQVFNAADGSSSTGYTLQFAEKSFTNLRIAGETKYGHLNRYFTLDGERISDNRVTDETLATSMSDISFTTLTTKGKEDYIGFEPGASVKVYINGTLNTTDTDASTGYTANDGIWNTAAEFYAVAEGGAAVAQVQEVGDANDGMGIIIEFIDTSAPKDSKYDVINIIQKTVHTLTGDSATKEVKNNDTQVKVPGVTNMGSFTASNTVENVVGYEGLKKGDVVLVYSSGTPAGADKTTFIEKAESVEGTVGGLNGTDKVTVNGTQYKKSNVANTSFNVTTWKDYKNTYAFYLDNAGAIVKAVKLTDVVDNYGYVLEAQWVTGNSLGASNYAEVRLLKMDGTVEVVPVSKINDVKVDPDDPATTIDDIASTFAMVAGNNPAPGTSFVTYKVSGGKYELTSVITTDKDGTKVENGKGQFVSGVYGNGNTVFLVNRDNEKDPKITVYTGTDNVPNVAASGNKVRVMEKDGIAKYVYIEQTTASSITGAGGTYVYFPGEKNPSTLAYDRVFTYVPESEDGKGNDYYDVPAIVNGELTTIKLKSVNKVVDAAANNTSDNFTAFATKTMYKVAATDVDGYVTELDVGKSDSVTSGVVELEGAKGVKYEAGIMTAGTTAYNVNKNTEIYYIDFDGAVTEWTYDSIQNDKTDMVYVVKDNSSTNTAEIVYIVEQISGTPTLLGFKWAVNGVEKTEKTGLTLTSGQTNTESSGLYEDDVIEILEISTLEGSYALSSDTAVVTLDGTGTGTITVSVTDEEGDTTHTMKLAFSGSARS